MKAAGPAFTELMDAHFRDKWATEAAERSARVEEQGTAPRDRAPDPRELARATLRRFSDTNRRTIVLARLVWLADVGELIPIIDELSTTRDPQAFVAQFAAQLALTPVDGVGDSAMESGTPSPHHFPPDAAEAFLRYLSDWVAHGDFGPAIREPPWLASGGKPRAAGDDAAAGPGGSAAGSGIASDDAVGRRALPDRDHSSDEPANYLDKPVPPQRAVMPGESRVIEHAAARMTPLPGDGEDGSAGQAAGPEGGRHSFPFCDVDLTLLAELASANSLTKVSELDGKSGMPKYDHMNDRLRVMEAAMPPLVERPSGKRSGYRITDAGRAELIRLGLKPP